MGLVDGELRQRVIWKVRNPEVDYVKKDSAPRDAHQVDPHRVAQPQDQVVEDNEDEGCEGRDGGGPEVGRLPSGGVHDVPAPELHREEADEEDYCGVEHSLRLHVHEGLYVEAFAELAHVVELGEQLVV